MDNLGSYFEIPVDDMERSIAFYQSVFGFDFSRDVIHGNQMAFFPFQKGNQGITGALAKGETYKPSTSGTLIYLNSENLEDSLKRIVDVGGEILFPKTEVPNYGWVAEFKDSEGNRIALFQKL